MSTKAATSHIMATISFEQTMPCTPAGRVNIR